MTTRREARRLALDVLYQTDVTSADGRSVLAEWEAADRAIPPYTRQLVDGVADSISQIDRTIGTYSEGWTVERMASLDRTILRVATYELTSVDSAVPVGAAIDEAVRAAKELSTDDSGRFVNGVLGKIAAGLGGPPNPA
jgi:transcription antitermination protein NusB